MQDSELQPRLFRPEGIYFRSGTHCVEGAQPCGAPTQVSRTKIPGRTEDVAGSRFVARERNVMYRPVALIAAEALAPLACVPSEAMETRCVEGAQPVGAPVHVSRTNTSATPLVSASTKFVAMDTKAT